MNEYYNKEYYNRIKGNCAFIELNPDNVKKVMRALYDSGIEFSASYGGYRNTVTVANEDRARAMAIADEYRFGNNRYGDRIIGNIEYGKIRDRNFINTDPATAMQVAYILSGDNSIHYSGRIQADRATITVSGRKNYDMVSRLVDNVRNADIIDAMTKEGFERLPDNNGAVVIRNNATGEVAGFRNMNMVRDMWNDSSNEFFHAPAYAVDKTEENDNPFYLSDTDGQNERNVFVEENMTAPMFPTEEAAANYAEQNNIPMAQTDVPVEHNEQTADKPEMRSNSVINTNLDLIDRFDKAVNDYPNVITYDDRADLFTWIFYDEYAGENGELIERSLTPEDIFEAYNARISAADEKTGRNAFISSLYANAYEVRYKVDDPSFTECAEKYLNLPVRGEALSVFSIYKDSGADTNIERFIDYMESYTPAVVNDKFKREQEKTKSDVADNKELADDTDKTPYEILLYRARAELERYEKSLDTVDKALAAAFELSTKRNILAYIDSYKFENLMESYPEGTIERFIKSENPLDLIFSEWTDNENDDITENLEDTVMDVVTNTFGVNMVQEETISEDNANREQESEIRQKYMQTIEIDIYSEPDENYSVKRIGTKTYKEVFSELEKHLSKNGLLPDEYFLFDSSLEDEEIPDDWREFTCSTNFGGSEGIYLDISLITGDNQIRFATGKTLGEEYNDFLNMSRIGAECSMMLNGNGARLRLPDPITAEKNIVVESKAVERKNDVNIIYPENSFEYGSYHFVPVDGEAVDFKSGDFRTATRNLVHDAQINLSVYSSTYKYDDFYKSSGDSPANIFECVETGKKYIPGDNELFEYTGEIDYSRQIVEEKNEIPAEDSHIHFGLLGNGITVYDTSREVDHDYPIVAHISVEGIISYYDRDSISDSDIQRIEEQAAQAKREFTEEWNKLDNVKKYQRIITAAGASRFNDIAGLNLSSKDVVKEFEHSIIFKDEPFPDLEAIWDKYKTSPEDIVLRAAELFAKKLGAYRDFYKSYSEGDVVVKGFTVNNALRIFVYEGDQDSFSGRTLQITAKDNNRLEIVFGSHTVDPIEIKSPEDLNRIPDSYSVIRDAANMVLQCEGFADMKRKLAANYEFTPYEAKVESRINEVETLKQQFVDKVQTELSEFLEDTGDASEYQINMKKDIAYFIIENDEYDFSGSQYKALLSRPYVLDELYTEWLSVDTDEWDEEIMTTFISDTADMIIRSERDNSVSVQKSAEQTQDNSAHSQETVSEETKSSTESKKKKIPNTNAHRIFKELNKRFPDIMSKAHSHEHYDSSGFEPLSVEWIGGNNISVMQTYTQYGDLMRDPDVVLHIDFENETANAISFENSGSGIYNEFENGSQGQKDTNSYMLKWFDILDEQGHYLTRATAQHRFNDDVYDIDLKFKDGKIISVDSTDEAAQDYIRQNGIEIYVPDPLTEIGAPRDLKIGDVISYEGRAWTVENTDFDDTEMIYITANDNSGDSHTFYDSDIISILEKGGFSFTNVERSNTPDNSEQSIPAYLVFGVGDYIRLEKKIWEVTSVGSTINFKNFDKSDPEQEFSYNGGIDSFFEENSYKYRVLSKAEINSRIKIAELEAAEGNSDIHDTVILSFNNGGRIWFSESGSLNDFWKAQDNISFALGNAIIEYLDNKQHIERIVPGLNAGWYKKTDFCITFSLNGKVSSYEGRYDIGDGAEEGGGSLIDHIRSNAEYDIKNEYSTDEDRAEAQETLDVLIPFLEKHSELTAEEQRIFNDYKAANPIRSETAIPFYTKSIKEAKETGEIEQYRISYDANVLCTRAILDASSKYTTMYSFDAEAVLNSVLSEYPADRVKYVIAASINADSPDGRISKSNSAWAKEYISSLPEEYSRRISDIYLGERIHTTAINDLATAFNNYMIVERGEKEQPNSAISQETPTDDVITSLIPDEQDKNSRLENELLRGSGFENGKKRIIDFYNEHSSEKKFNSQFAAFLKKEYGIGGHSGEGNVKLVNYDDRGISIEYEQNGAKTKDNFTWNAVAKKISELITDNRYMPENSVTTRDNSAISQKEPEKDVAPVFRDVPLYTYSFEEAEAEGEEDLYHISAQENRDCARFLDENIAKFYNDNSLDTDAVLNATLAVYPAERIELVIAANMAGKNYDARYNRDNIDWADEIINDLPADIRIDSRRYNLTAHPGLINLMGTAIHNYMELNREQDDPALEQAKAYIREYLDNEFGSEENFKDLRNISIGYTELGDNNEYSFQAEADLVEHNINFYLDNQIFKTLHYDSLEEMNDDFLDGLHFDDVVAYGNEELDNRNPDEVSKALDLYRNHITFSVIRIEGEEPVVSGTTYVDSEDIADLDEYQDFILKTGKKYSDVSVEYYAIGNDDNTSFAAEEGTASYIQSHLTEVLSHTGCIILDRDTLSVKTPDYLLEEYEQEQAVVGRKIDVDTAHQMWENGFDVFADGKVIDGYDFKNYDNVIKVSAIFNSEENENVSFSAEEADIETNTLIDTIAEAAMDFSRKYISLDYVIDSTEWLESGYDGDPYNRVRNALAIGNFAPVREYFNEAWDRISEDERSDVNKWDAATEALDKLRNILPQYLGKDSHTAYYYFPEGVSNDRLWRIRQQSAEYAIAAPTAALSDDFMREKNIHFYKVGRDIHESFTDFDSRKMLGVLSDKHLLESAKNFSKETGKPFTEFTYSDIITSMPEDEFDRMMKLYQADEFKIYQVKDGEEYHYKRFAHLNELDEAPNIADYDLVYTGHLSDYYRFSDLPGEFDQLFVAFNLNRPADYKGRSMSTSDVLVLHGDTSYYVEGIGYEMLAPDFLEIGKKPETKLSVPEGNINVDFGAGQSLVIKDEWETGEHDNIDHYERTRTFTYKNWVMRENINTTLNGEDFIPEVFNPEDYSSSSRDMSMEYIREAVEKALKRPDRYSVEVVGGEEKELSGINVVDPDVLDRVIETRKPREMFLAQEGDRWVGVDNRDGDAWTEDFATKEEAIRWLNDEVTPEERGSDTISKALDLEENDYTFSVITLDNDKKIVVGGQVTKEQITELDEYKKYIADTEKGSMLVDVDSYRIGDKHSEPYPADEKTCKYISEHLNDVLESSHIKSKESETHFVLTPAKLLAEVMPEGRERIERDTAVAMWERGLTVYYRGNELPQYEEGKNNRDSVFGVNELDYSANAEDAAVFRIADSIAEHIWNVNLDFNNETNKAAHLSLTNSHSEWSIYSGSLTEYQNTLNALYGGDYYAVESYLKNIISSEDVSEERKENTSKILDLVSDFREKSGIPANFDQEKFLFSTERVELRDDHRGLPQTNYYTSSVNQYYVKGLGWIDESEYDTAQKRSGQNAQKFYANVEYINASYIMKDGNIGQQDMTKEEYGRLSMWTYDPDNAETLKAAKANYEERCIEAGIPLEKPVESYAVRNVGYTKFEIISLNNEGKVSVVKPDIATFDEAKKAILDIFNDRQGDVKCEIIDPQLLEERAAKIATEKLHTESGIKATDFMRAMGVDVVDGDNLSETDEPDLSDINVVTPEMIGEVIETREPRDMFLAQEGDRWVGVDNRTGDAWTEDFGSKGEAVRWLHGEDRAEIDIMLDLKLRDNNLKFSVITIDGEKPFVVGGFAEKDEVTALDEVKEYLNSTGKDSADVKSVILTIGTNDKHARVPDENELKYLAAHLDDVLAYKSLYGPWTAATYTYNLNAADVLPEKSKYRSQVQAIYEYENAHNIPEAERLTKWYDEQNVSVAKSSFMRGDVEIGISETLIAARYNEIMAELSEKAAPEPYEPKLGDKFIDKRGEEWELTSLTGVLPWYTDQCAIRSISGGFAVEKNETYTNLLDPAKYTRVVDTPKIDIEEDEITTVKVKIIKGDIDELREHLEMNGYHAEWDGNTFLADEEEIDYIETVMNDRNITYTIGNDSQEYTPKVGDLIDINDSLLTITDINGNLITFTESETLFAEQTRMTFADFFAQKFSVVNEVVEADEPAEDIPETALSDEKTRMSAAYKYIFEESDRIWFSLERDSVGESPVDDYAYHLKDNAINNLTFRAQDGIGINPEYDAYIVNIAERQDNLGITAIVDDALNSWNENTHNSGSDIHEFYSFALEFCLNRLEQSYSHSLGDNQEHIENTNPDVLVEQPQEKADTLPDISGITDFPDTRFTALSESAKRFMSNLAHFSSPHHSPWGEVQNARELAPGVFDVSTASHGGVIIRNDIASKILSKEALKIGFTEMGYHCYEEDCDYAVPYRELLDKGVIAVPDYYKGTDEEFYNHLDKSIQRWYPDYWKARAETIYSALPVDVKAEKEGQISLDDVPVEHNEQPVNNSDITIKNLAQLKRALTVGAEFRMTNYNRSGVENQLRRVHYADTTGFYTIRPDAPDDKVTLANNGRGSYLDWGKRGDWEFNGADCTLYAKGKEHTEENKILSFTVTSLVPTQEKTAGEKAPEQPQKSEKFVMDYDKGIKHPIDIKVDYSKLSDITAENADSIRRSERRKIGQEGNDDELSRLRIQYAKFMAGIMPRGMEITNNLIKDTDEVPQTITPKYIDIPCDTFEEYLSVSEKPVEMEFNYYQISGKRELVSRAGATFDVCVDESDPNYALPLAETKPEKAKSDDTLYTYDENDPDKSKVLLRSVTIDLTPKWEREQQQKQQTSTIDSDFWGSTDYLVDSERGQNYVITDENLGAATPKVRYRANIEAIKVLKEIEHKNLHYAAEMIRPQAATPEQQAILARYTGWGAIPDVFDASKSDWSKEYEELKGILTEEEYAAARKSTMNAHFTSPTVINAIYQGLAGLGFEQGDILEPAMGIGNFFGAMPESMRGSELHGVELDSITGRIARQLYPAADIQVKGFEQTRFKNDSFDVVVGNVPFGDYKVDDKDYNKHKFLIHDYFIAKALDKVRPGGIVAVVTSKGTMDKENSDVRKYIAQRAELLGAIRLPNTAFKANAGTEVTSDILFFQKRERPIEIRPEDIEWLNRSETENGLLVNNYFVQHPEMVLGRIIEGNKMYGTQQGNTSCEPIPGKDLKEQLAEAIKNIKGTYTAVEKKKSSKEIEDVIPAPPDSRIFSYYAVDGAVYFRDETEDMTRVNLKGESLKKAIAMIEIRENVRELLDLQLNNADHSLDRDIEISRNNLNVRYDAFVEKYGHFDDKRNTRVLKGDDGYNFLTALEEKDKDGKYTKAAIFSHDTVKPNVVVTHVDTAEEALILSVAEKAKVDFDYMTELCGHDKDTLIKELEGQIFRLPQEEEVYVTADEYLTGNIRIKLRELNYAPEGMDVSKHREALEAAMPKKIEAKDITVKLGSHWVDPKYVEQFIKAKFNPGWRSHIEVHYSKASGRWKIEGMTNGDKQGYSAANEFGTRRRNAYDILEGILNHDDLTVKDVKLDEHGEPIIDSKGNYVKVTNHEETKAVQTCVRRIENEWADWIFKDPDRRTDLVERYNEVFNSYRHREYDGSHLSFIGMNTDITLKDHQKNAVARALYGGNTLLAHAVGAGKSFEMITIAMEGKRLGLHSKCLFAVPNALTEQMGRDFKRLYPAANVLVATKKDFEPKNRKRLFARIATGEWDAVIVGHSQFDRMGLSSDRVKAYMEAEIASLRIELEEARSTEGQKSFSVKEIEKTIAKYEKKLKDADKISKDGYIDFEQMGFDKLFVDECHMYKNLGTATKMSNVAGITVTGSAKAAEFLMKTRYFDELTGGKGIVAASGTPVSNSMTELYTMMRYLQTDLLNECGIKHFDEWAADFGIVVTDYDFCL